MLQSLHQHFLYFSSTSPLLLLYFSSDYYSKLHLNAGVKSDVIYRIRISSHLMEHMLKINDDVMDKNSREVSNLIKEYLGFSDVDFTLSKFVINLYEKSSRSKHEERFESFKSLVNQNGGDSLPMEFLEILFQFLCSTEKKENPVVVKSEVNYDLENKSDAQEMIQKKKFEKEEFDLSIGGIYNGFVDNIMAYGAFIRLNNQRSSIIGLCHISNILFDGRSRIRHPSDVLEKGEHVFVKVLSVESNQPKHRFEKPKRKIRLTMRGIDQMTGLDRSMELVTTLEQEKRGRKDKRQVVPNKRKYTSPERWEIRQLIASGAAKPEDYLDAFRDDDSVFSMGSNIGSNLEVDVDVEVRQDEPKFLKGKLKNSVELAPSKIITNPEGSMSRSAMNGSKLAKNFKEKVLSDQKIKENERHSEKKINDDDPLKEEGALSDIDSRGIIFEWRKERAKEKITYGKRSNLSLTEQKKSLPVYSMRNEIIQKVKDNQFLVVVGETGSGKTTQIVQYLNERGFSIGNDGEIKLIGCTQPRRVAAMSVAKRVAEEMNSKLGEEVGYYVRFDDKSGPLTRIKYMTDGMLEREAITDPLMKKYSVIMLDEAHERTISTDVLFALLKVAAFKNPDLKVIVTSATLDAEKFSSYFNECPILKIPGRSFPVEILYTKEPELDYVAAALDSVMQIHLSEPKGDILVFLTGQEEIDTSCELLFQRLKSLGDSIPELVILPVYSALPSEIQSKIFEPTSSGSRKVIFATNIAETSITIDGIYYVVDPGFVKLNSYDPKLGIESLRVSPISQAQANQRSGRAGRTGPGKCYRLYTENAFKTEMLPNTIPEIQRQNLSHTLLTLKAIGINDLISFDFMDRPPTRTILSALQTLYTLELLDESGNLTLLGKKVSVFPMEPALAKLLIASSMDFQCSEEILSIVAMLSVQSIFYRPKDNQKLADQRKARFNHSQGDHLTLLNVFRSWTLNGYSKQWCQDNFIHERSMRKANEVRRQLVGIMNKYKQPILSCGSETDRVRKSLCSAYFKNTARRDPQEGYKTLVESLPVFLHPSSSLYGKSPGFIIYNTLLSTTKEYMQCSTEIEPSWLAEFAPSYFKVLDPMSAAHKSKSSKITPLQNKFSKEKNSWRLSSQNGTKKRMMGNG